MNQSKGGGAQCAPKRPTWLFWRCRYLLGVDIVTFIIYCFHLYNKYFLLSQSLRRVCYGGESL